MPDAAVLVAIVLDGLGYTGRLTVRQDACLPPGLRRDPTMMHVGFPAPPGQPDFLATTQLAHSVALNHYGLSPGFSLEWSIIPCAGGNLHSLEGSSAGAPFLLALMKSRLENWNIRALRVPDDLDTAIAAVQLDWIAVTATIDPAGRFGPVGELKRKLDALIREQAVSHVRLAVIADADQPPGDRTVVLDSVDGSPELFMFTAPGLGQLPVLKATDAADCYRKLFQLQSVQVLS